MITVYVQDFLCRMKADLLLKFSRCSSWSDKTALFEELLQSTVAKPKSLGPYLPYIQYAFYEEPASARKLAYECAINLITAVPSVKFCFGFFTETGGLLQLDVCVL